VNTSTTRRWNLVETLGVDASHLHQRRVGDREPAEVGEGAQDVDVVGVVRGTAVLGGVAQQARSREVTHEGVVDPGGLEQFLPVVGGLLRTLEQPGERTRVVAFEEGVDGGEREATRLQRADALQAFQVLGAEAAGAAVAFAGAQQALSLVVADRVDGDAGPLGQFVDAPVAHGK